MLRREPTARCSARPRRNRPPRRSGLGPSRSGSRGSPARGPRGTYAEARKPRPTSRRNSRTSKTPRPTRRPSRDTTKVTRAKATSVRRRNEKKARDLLIRLPRCLGRPTSPSPSAPRGGATPAEACTSRCTYRRPPPSVGSPGERRAREVPATASPRSPPRRSRPAPRWRSRWTASARSRRAPLRRRRSWSAARAGRRETRRRFFLPLRATRDPPRCLVRNAPRPRPPRRRACRCRRRRSRRARKRKPS